jgi:hypothetical protein
MDIRSKLSIKVHDAVIVGLEYREKSELSLDLALAGDYRTRLVMQRPRTVGIAGFVARSIVLDVEAFELDSECPPVEHPVWGVLFTAGLWPHNDTERLQLVAAQCRLGGLLVYVECSYGGDLAAICSDVSGATTSASSEGARAPT